ncbi:MAG TPA: bifunctional hydroxymethylpyrimidine kinase/phosphomethylpyrimidine kinase [Thermoanaerobaculia bacterium]|nr:bifunctional hydroxymethylpyrimidine kinase/phosphomethylpyrimidine kinase [Thermoanaerobaculia bacterium]
MPVLELAASRAEGRWGPSRPARPLRVLAIGGSDSGGGAGIQADLKTIAAHGAYGMSVVTAVTAQNTREVRGVHVVPAAMVAAQIDAVLDDIGADAVKIGMLADAAVVRAVAERLRSRLGAPAASGGLAAVPIVVDPILESTSGTVLLTGASLAPGGLPAEDRRAAADDAVAALLEELLPLATLVTPNLPELVRLSGLPAGDEPQRRRAAQALAAQGAAVLVKGGHVVGEGEAGRRPGVGAPAADGEIVDLLLAGGRFHRYPHPRLATASTHGTGCTLATAIAVRLAAGAGLREAVGGAIGYLQQALAAAPPLGRGRGPVDHFFAWRGKVET